MLVGRGNVAQAHKRFRMPKCFRILETWVPRAFWVPIFGPCIRLGVAWRSLVEIVMGDELVVEIDPQRIVGFLGHLVASGGRQRDIRSMFIVPGDWDVHPLSPETHPTYRRMADLVEFSDYRASPSYQELLNSQKLPRRVKKVGRKFGDGTADDYFEFYRRLAETIKAEGRIPDYGASDKDKYIGLAIGRDGQILQFQKGRHRIALARLLHCPKVSGKVLAVHPQWFDNLRRGTNLPPAKALATGVARLAE